MSTVISNAVTALSGNLALAPEGTGVVTVDGLTFPSADGSANQVIKTNGSGVLSFTDAGGGFTQADSQATTSGTLKTFGSIPSGVKMIVVSYFDISMSGDGGAGDAIQLTLGDAGGLETSGYVSMRAQLRSSANILFDDTANFELSDHLAASSKYRGSAILTLQDVAAYRWICQWQTMDTDNAATVNVGAGSKALSAELTQVGFGTTNGFDLGSVSIMYQQDIKMKKYTAVVSHSGGKITKYQDFDTKDEADAHVASFGGKVVEDLDANIEYWDVSGDTPTKDTDQLAADKLAAKWARVRNERDIKLAATDWMAMPDSPDISDAWKKYRSDLRDVGGQSDVDNITWPSAPE